MDEHRENDSVKSEDRLKEVKYVPNAAGELKPENEERKPDTFFLGFAVLSGTLALITGGSAVTWTSPALKRLTSNDTSVNPLVEPLTTIEISLISGLPQFIAIIGSFASMYIPNQIGRKKSLLLSGIVMVICNIIVAFSNRAMLILIPRCIFFISFHFALSVLAVYSPEICEEHNRAKYSCFVGMAVPFGNFYTYVIGPYFSIRIFTIMSLIPVIFFLILFPFAPESPVFFIMKGKKTECINSLKKLRNNKTRNELEKDLIKIEESLTSQQTSGTKRSNPLLLKELKLGLFLIGFLVMIQFISGAPILMAFLAPVFDEADTILTGNQVAILIGIVKTSMYIGAAFLIERLGRRTLMLLSCTGMGVTMFLLGGYFYLKFLNVPLDQFNWVPLPIMIIYIISFAIGIGPVPFALLGELFAPEVRATASAAMTIVIGFSVFIFSGGFPLVAEYAGLHWCMWIFGFNCIIGIIFIFLMVPETKGKSAEDIQRFLRNFKFSLNAAKI